MCDPYNVFKMLIKIERYTTKSYRLFTLRREKKRLKKSQNFFNLFKEHSFLHKIQDDLPINTYFMKLWRRSNGRIIF